MMNIVDGQTSTENRIGALFFALFYALHKIDSPIPGVEIGELLLAASMIALLLTKGRCRIRLYGIYGYLFILFYLYCILTLVDAVTHRYVDMTGIAVRTIRWAFYIFSTCVVAQLISRKYLYRYVVMVALLSAAVLILQVTVYALVKYPIYFSLFGEQVGYSTEYFLTGGSANRLYRFSAFFSEPAHFAYFESLALVMLLFFNDQPNKRQLLAAGFIVCSMLLSTSTYAFALLAVVAMCFLFKRFRRGTSIRINILMAAILIVVIVCLYLFLQNTSLAFYAATKFQNIGSSSRTTFIWNSGINFSTFDILFGCGVGNEEYYLLKQYGVQIGYMNSLSLAFLYGGVTGIAMTAVYLLSALVRLNEKGRVPFLILIAMSAFSTAFFSTAMVLFTVAAEVANERIPRVLEDKTDNIMREQ